MRGEGAMAPRVSRVAATAGAGWQRAVMAAGLRGLQTPGEPWPHSARMGAAKPVFAEVKASDLTQKKPFLQGLFADHHKHTVSVLT